jgi:hypothetical protein
LEGIDVDLVLTLKLKDYERVFDMPFYFKVGLILVININPNKDALGIPAIIISKDKNTVS